jgi:hypothetical protein
VAGVLLLFFAFTAFFIIKAVFTAAVTAPLAEKAVFAVMLLFFLSRI